MFNIELENFAKLVGFPRNVTVIIREQVDFNRAVRTRLYGLINTQKGRAPILAYRSFAAHREEIRDESQFGKKSAKA
jgi:hypothetical protein